MTHVNPLNCYRCGLNAEPGDARCSRCNLKLDWAAISDLRSIDYLRMRVLQWQHLGVINVVLAQRMLAEVEHNRVTLTRMLSGVAPPMHPSAGPPPADSVPPPAPLPPPVPVARPPMPNAATPIPPSQVPPQRIQHPSAGEPPPFFAPGERPARGPSPTFGYPAAEPSRRNLVDALVDFGTVRLMLYAGALLLAAGILVWLRDTLREQLQKPMVQASVLATITVATLSGGVALIVRSRDRAEQRIIGRGFLLLGTLLLPVNPWFWLQSGLIESRGNAWIVTLVTFAVSTAIAFGLGDRIFVVLSYAFALATAWLLTFKLTGGAPAGVYALSIAVISLVYLLGEWPVSRSRPGDGKWTGIARTMFGCGHAGLATVVVLHSVLAAFVPYELLAVFRHFTGVPSEAWLLSAIPAVAAAGYFWSAWRQKGSIWTFVGSAAAAWAVIEFLLHEQVRPGTWLVAAAVMAFVFHFAGRLLRSRDEFGPALESCGRVFAWIGFLCIVIAAIGYTSFDQPVRVATACGALLLAVVFAFDAVSERTLFPAAAATAIVWLGAGYVARELGASWAVTATALAATLVALPFALDRIGDDRAANRTGARTATSILVLVSGVALLALIADSPTPSVGRLIPLGLFVAAAAVVHGWTTRAPLVRYPAYVFGMATLQLAALMSGAEVIRYFDWVEGRYAVFVLLPYVTALLGSWFALGSAVDLRTVALRRVVRVATSFAVFVAALAALPLIVDSVLSADARYLFALAMGLLSLAPLAIAARQRDAAVAHVEAVFGWLFVVAGWFALTAAVARDTAISDTVIVALFLGTGPIVLAAIGRLTADRLPAIGNAALGVGCVAAILLLPGNLIMAGDDFGNADAFKPVDRAAMFTFGFLSLAFALWRCCERWIAAWPVIWSIVAIVPAACVGRGVVVSAATEGTGIAIVGILAVAVFGLRGLLAAREHALALPALPVAHSLAGVTLLSALGAVAGAGVTWTTVTAFALATAGYAVAGFAAERTQPSVTLHRGLSIVFAYLSYAMIGLRYSLGPWDDVAYYTLPPGLLLVSIGAVMSRREDSEGEGALMWLGSLIAAMPMLLHALESRFVLGAPSVGYDMATIAIGLVLAIVGRAVMYRGPFLTGAGVFVFDIVVVILGAIKWQDLPPAIYLAALGAMLFGTAWVLLYKREQLRRFSSWLGDSAASIREWR